MPKETIGLPPDSSELPLQLATMLKSISQGVYMIGADGRVNLFNPRLCELLDLPPAFMASRPTFEEMTGYQTARGDFGPNASLVETSAKEYVVSQGATSGPEQYLRTTRQGRVLEVKFHPLDHGGMVKTFTDVTDYVKAQDALARSENLLRQVTSQVPGMVYRIHVSADGRRRYSFVSEGVKSIFGVTPEEAIADANVVLSLIHPDDDASKVSEMARVKDAPLPVTSEFRLLLRDGTVKWIQMTSAMESSLDGAVIRDGVVLDITAERASQDALIASEALLREVTSRVPGMVYRLHIDRLGRKKFKFVSQGVTALYGLTPEAVLADGDCLDHYCHPEDRLRIFAELTTAIGLRQQFSTEFRLVLGDQAIKWVQVTNSEVARDAEGVLAIGVAIDITARKRGEAALRERDELWKLALESSGDGVWDWYVQTGVEIFSRRILEMYGFAEGELANECEELDRRTHPDDVEQMRRDRQDHFDGLAPTYLNEHRIQCKDGSWKWVMSRGMVISRDADGKPLRMTGTHTDITARKQAESLIWQQANFDALTGLPNRRMLIDRLAQDIKKCRRDTQKLAVLFIDLDHFKEVNDTLGHGQGDALLIEAANRISGCVRETDTVARMGGDEFTVILPLVGNESLAEQVAEKIIEVLSAPFLLVPEKAFVSASIGITMYPGDASSIEDLFKHADQALYVAKGAGRNRFSYFTPALQSAAQTRVRLTNDLRGALAQSQLWLAYQPIVELRSGRIYKAEALLRWQHPERGLISPTDFIPIAEASGQIVDIGDWVFRQAAQQVAQWRHALHPQFQISVNKSPVQFHSDRHDQSAWFDYLRALKLPGDSMVMEITEGLLLDANPNVNQQLLNLRDEGVGVSLDDFGTGYSSLSYLQKYDIDFLKIDQSFVRGLLPNSKDMSLCKAIISMAHELGMIVIAEGVETGAQRDLLTVAGCDYAQGYLFARPMPAADFEQFCGQTE